VRKAPANGAAPGDTHDLLRQSDSPATNIISAAGGAGPRHVALRTSKNMPHEVRALLHVNGEVRQVEHESKVALNVLASTFLIGDWFLSQRNPK